MSGTADLITALGHAYRGDWGGFDGRILCDQLEDVAAILRAELAGEDVADLIAVARRNFYLCAYGADHWRSSCSLYGCEATP